MLLRVSSDQQLEADGDLSIQRQILMDYINKQKDWRVDSKKEYFEGSISAYKNTSANREILQKILKDAKRGEFDILVLYKDDRVGRLMWDTPLYIMNLKSYGVDIFSVKDGCLSPEADDIMGQMMLSFRYANAQKSSADTGMRVKDTAEKMVQNGKFMGGKAPYGYQLDFSGEISKHGRALKHLVIVPEQAETVRYIYSLAANQEYGSSKIAKILNNSEEYKDRAPNDVWKGGTITSILTNPVYAGYTAYKRREKQNGKFHRLDISEWTIAGNMNPDIVIIDLELWNRVQEKRKQRKDKYTKKLENLDVTIMKRNDGILALIDVAHCGYCGSKLTNGTKYNYWTMKDTGERRTSKIAVYKCQHAWQGIPHDKKYQFRADLVEPVIFNSFAKYIGKLQENEDVFEAIARNQTKEKRAKERDLDKERQELSKIGNKIDTMESKIPDAMMGDYPLSLEELMTLIRKQKDIYQEQEEKIRVLELTIKNMAVSLDERDDLKTKIPTWQDVFLNADTATKRVLVNRLIERIDIKKDEIIIRFKINLDESFPGP